MLKVIDKSKSEFCFNDPVWLQILKFKYKQAMGITYITGIILLHEYTLHYEYNGHRLTLA